MKYYNKNHKSRKFVVDELILLFIKNLNQKRLNKKMFFKFTKSFRIENKVECKIDIVDYSSATLSMYI